MYCIKRFSRQGTETIYRHESLKTVTAYLELVMKRNTLFKKWEEIVFLDGEVGLRCTKQNNTTIDYKITNY